MNNVSRKEAEKHFFNLESRYGDSEEKIIERYRSLVKKYHPDINKEESAKEKAKEINQAYQYLIKEGKYKVNPQSFGEERANERYRERESYSQNTGSIFKVFSEIFEEEPQTNKRVYQEVLVDNVSAVLEIPFHKWYNDYSIKVGLRVRENCDCTQKCNCPKFLFLVLSHLRTCRIKRCRVCYGVAYYSKKRFVTLIMRKEKQTLFMYRGNTFQIDVLGWPPNMKVEKESGDITIYIKISRYPRKDHVLYLNSEIPRKIIRLDILQAKNQHIFKNEGAIKNKSLERGNLVVFFTRE